MDDCTRQSITVFQENNVGCEGIRKGKDGKAERQKRKSEHNNRICLYFLVEVTDKEPIRMKGEKQNPS